MLRLRQYVLLDFRWASILCSKELTPQSAAMIVARNEKLQSVVTPGARGCQNADTKAIADPKEIRRGLTLLHPKSDIVELRAINNNTSYNATGYFTNFELYITEAVRLNSQGFTIYSIVNELNPNLLNLASNKIAPGLKNTAKDKHVIRRRCLPIDIDPEREPKDISSTDMEHQSALEMMYKISRWLPTFGIPEESIALADSGNGGHFTIADWFAEWWAIKSSYWKCLKAVKQKFSTAEMIVDTSICNAARIWKTYGTVSRKGDDTTERPHRLASILRMPTIWKPIEVGILNKLPPWRQMNHRLIQRHKIGVVAMDNNLIWNRGLISSG